MKKQKSEEKIETPLTKIEQEAIEKLNPADPTDRVLLNLYHRLAFPERHL